MQSEERAIQELWIDFSKSCEWKYHDFGELHLVIQAVLQFDPTGFLVE